MSDQGELFAAPKPLPPYARGSDTSLAAAVSVREDAATMRARVFSHIKRQGDRGATCWECEEALKMQHQTASARIYELRHEGHIEDSGARRPTGSGRKAVVWQIIPPETR